ncbi:TOG array regulator of axonemal microtubules protein 1-like [Engystomops pustulosus]|uniref:TOG array regulator of axonemal microtubules protein 1-like n=1 Tax=Engystomops pustulosus TaxID=76066 RepID=UPI003AFB6CA5
MWESDSIRSGSDSELSDISAFYLGMELPSSKKFCLGDNFTAHRDIAAQKVLAKLSTNTLRNPRTSPVPGERRTNMGWTIPNTPVPRQQVTKNLCYGDKYPTPAASAQIYLGTKIFEPCVPKKMSVLPPIRHSSSPHEAQPQKATTSTQPKTFPEPKMAVSEAVRLLDYEDWEKKMKGIETIFSLLSSHAEYDLQTVRDLRTAVIKEVTNLRSAVSLAAIKCLNMMFCTWKTQMDHDLQQIAKVLLHKAGEANSFIRDAVDSTLISMVNNVSPGRALVAVIEGGLCHKNSSVRSTTSKHLAGLVDRKGAEYILSGRKGVTDRALPAIAKCIQDSCPQARMHGKKILSTLSGNPRLDSMIKKYVPPKDTPAVMLLLRKCSK